MSEHFHIQKHLSNSWSFCEIHDIFCVWMFFPWKSWTFFKSETIMNFVFKYTAFFLKSTNCFLMLELFLNPVNFYWTRDLFRVRELFSNPPTFFYLLNFLDVVNSFETNIFFRINELFLNSLFLKTYFLTKSTVNHEPVNRHQRTGETGALRSSTCLLDWASPHGGACVVIDPIVIGKPGFQLLFYGFIQSFGISFDFLLDGFNTIFFLYF